MLTFDPMAYGPALAALLETDRCRPLDAGRPDSSTSKQLRELSVSTAFEEAEVVDQVMAACCLAGVWLLYDYLDESHTISQSIDTTSGSYWHAIMHRREGDFSNSKYWLRRVGKHPVIGLVGEQLGQQYDPFAFVDECEKVVHGKAGDQAHCLDVQQREWETLFDYCFRAATNKYS